MIGGLRVAVVLPAYNAERTLARTVAELDREVADDILLVDDASTDATPRLARELGLHVVLHPKNVGYGGNQKTCYRTALARGADIVVMVHPDYQYSPRLMPSLAAMVASGEYDVALGSRILGNGAVAGGMPRYKYVANRILTACENVMLGTKVSEFHTGYRAYSRQVLTAIRLDELSDSFVFDNQILTQVLATGFRIGEISCPTRYAADSSSIGFGASLRYGFGVLATAADYRLHVLGWRRRPYLERTDTVAEPSRSEPDKVRPRLGSDPTASLSKCGWCGALLGPNTSTLASYHVVRCKACLVGTTVPAPTDEQLDAAYAAWYRPAGGRFSSGGDRLLRWLRGRTARWIDATSPAGPVLDVGSGDGSMLDALHRRGRYAIGLERHSNRPDVRSVNLAECESGWSAIVMWHSLEHLPAPRQALREAAQRLAPGGQLVVAVPNIGSVQSQVFGDRWLHLDLPRHLSHLTVVALSQAMKDDGLVLTQVSHLRGGQVTFGWLDGLVGSLPGHPDLYQAIRRPSARESSNSRGRLATLTAAAVLTPVAILAAGLEVALRRGGTVCLVARRPE